MKEIAKVTECLEFEIKILGNKSLDGDTHSLENRENLKIDYLLDDCID